MTSYPNPALHLFADYLGPVVNNTWPWSGLLFLAGVAIASVAIGVVDFLWRLAYYCQCRSPPPTHTPRAFWSLAALWAVLVVAWCCSWAYRCPDCFGI